jgi:peptidoglycan/LPS O-acetylase OafA/YrhL
VREARVSPPDARLAVARAAALVAGSIALVAAMLLLDGQPRWRDLAWSVGVALLVLALVANRLLARQAKGEKERQVPPPRA